MDILEFDYNNYDKKKNIIVYGTGAIGKIVRYCLNKRNIQVSYYVNEEGNGSFYGTPVIGIEKLEELCKNNSSIILLAVGVASEDVAFKLRTHNIDIVYSVYNILEDVKQTGDLLGTSYMERYMYFYRQARFITPEKLVLRTLDIVVTEKCSLRCGKCSNLMQYYKFPRNFDVFEIKEMLDRALTAIDMIYELRILGGEPFMNRDFYELIEWYVDHKKIKKIAIFTNATIFLSEEKRKILINPKIIMKISDYGELSIKLYDWIKWCENNHVEYMVSKLEKWQDCGNLKKHNYREDELKYLYRTCECRDLPTLINGKLYNCPYAANAVNLGALYDDEAEKDAFDLMDKSHLKDRIKKFLFEKEYLYACDYCAGRNYKRASIPAHEQVSSALDFIKNSGKNSWENERQG